MTATGAAPARVTTRQISAHVASYGVAGVYAILVAAAILHHEPWADEAQAWLLARDASLVQLWRDLLHYEGAPGLWQTLLHWLQALGLTYSGYKFVSGFCGLVATGLLVRFAPLPAYIRLLLPFTYYLCYQYAVVARSYALLAPLLFACAALYQQAHRRPALFTTLLCLIAGVSVHGVIISGIIWLAVATRVFGRWQTLGAAERRRLLAAGCVYSIVVLLLVLSAWPAGDVGFAEQRGLGSLTWPRFAGVAKDTFGEAFTGEWITSILLVALSLPFLWRSGGGAIFLSIYAALCIFGTMVYAQKWHYGVVWLVWLFAMWISAARGKLSRVATGTLLAAIAVQCYWSFAAISYDWKYPYSGSAEAASYLHRQPPPAGELYAIGYHSTAIEPYFSANLFSDFHQGSPIAYWDWSNRNSAAKDPFALFSSAHREQVLVGYRELAEKEYWASVLAPLGYERIRHFEGNVFWHTRILEPEAMDLYRRSAHPESTASSLQMNDKLRAAQLLAGLYAVESNSWRWTAKRFSMALRTPPGAKQNGAKLTLRFFLPEVQIRKLGPMTLTANVDGEALGSETFFRSGAYTYSARVPAGALQKDVVAVNFRFDKAVAGAKTDFRELAAIATFVALEPNP